jgi:hypothetical protein
MGIPVSHWRFRLSVEVGFTGFTGFTLSALDLTWTLQFLGSCDVIGGGRARAGSFAPTNAKGALIWLPGVSNVLYFLTEPKHTHRDLVVAFRSVRRRAECVNDGRVANGRTGTGRGVGRPPGAVGVLRFIVAT